MARVVGNGPTATSGGSPTPSSTAADMAAALRRFGFEVTTGFDAVRFPPAPSPPLPHVAALDPCHRPGTPAAGDGGRSMVVVDLDPQASATKWSDLRTADTPGEASAHGARLTSVGRSGGW